MYILLALNIIGFAIMLSKFFVFSRQRGHTPRIAEGLKKRIQSQNPSKDPNALIELSKQELSGHIGTIERGLNTVKVIASVAPLLGLLGTVIGVLIAFRVMAETGLNNPASFAKGISMALITTVGGMMVAIPHYIGHNYLIGMLDRIEANLEKELLNKVL